MTKHRLYRMSPNEELQLRRELGVAPYRKTKVMRDEVRLAVVMLTFALFETKEWFVAYRRLHKLVNPPHGIAPRVPSPTFKRQQHAEDCLKRYARGAYKKVVTT